MADVSNKTGPRQDEDLKSPTRGGEDSKDPGADREHTDEVLRPDVPGADREEEATERSDLATFLEPSMFPADRDALLAAAESNFAPDWVMERLRRLTPDREFAILQEVWDSTEP